MGLSLSICLLTDAPAVRLERILEPLRPHAGEVVVAVDAGVGEEHLDALTQVADRVIPVIGRLAAWMIKDFRLPSPGMLPVVSSAVVLLSYSLTTVAGGSVSR